MSKTNSAKSGKKSHFIGMEAFHECIENDRMYDKIVKEAGFRMRKTAEDLIRVLGMKGFGFELEEDSVENVYGIADALFFDPENMEPADGFVFSAEHGDWLYRVIVVTIPQDEMACRLIPNMTRTKGDTTELYEEDGWKDISKTDFGIMSAKINAMTDGQKEYYSVAKDGYGACDAEALEFVEGMLPLAELFEACIGSGADVFGSVAEEDGDDMAYGALADESGDAVILLDDGSYASCRFSVEESDVNHLARITGIRRLGSFEEAKRIFVPCLN